MGHSAMKARLQLLANDLLDVRVDACLVRVSPHVFHDRALAIDVESFREHRHIAVACGQRAIGKQDGIRDTQALRCCGNLGLRGASGFNVYIDAEEREPRSCVLLLQLLKDGHLLQARRAPRRPKVDYHRFAREVFQGNALAGDIT